MIITGFEDIYEIYNVQIKQKAGMHSFCTFSALVEEKDIEKYIGYARNHKKIVICRNDDRRLLMSGIVQKIDISYRYLHTGIQLDVIISSESKNMDQEIHNRIFQSVGKTFQSIVKQIMEQYSYPYFCNFDIPIKEPVIQKEISDFKFLCSLAAENNMQIWVEETGHMMIGKNEKKRETPVHTWETATIYQRILEEESEKLIFETRDLIKMGTKVKDFGKEYEIQEIEIYEEVPYIYYRYTAVSIPSYEIRDKKEEKREQFLLGQARVINVDDKNYLGRIQVEFLEWEDVNKGANDLFWVEYLTPYTGKENAGFIFIPDVGDIVEVISFHKRLIAIGSCRKKELAQNFREISNKKYIHVLENLGIWLEEEKMSLSYGNNTKFILDKQGLSFQCTDSSVCISKDSISSKVKESNLCIKEHSILIKKGNTQMEVSDQKLKLTAPKIQMDT